MATLQKKKVKLGLFDIDGTIFRSSLFLELFYDLINHGIFPKKARDAVEPFYQAWLDRKGHYNDYLIKTIQVHYQYLIGKPSKHVDRITRVMLAKHKDRVYRYTRDLIGELKRKKYYLIAISNSQEYVVSQFARNAGFDAAIARGMEIKNGRYTGRTLSGDRFVRIEEHLDKVQLLKDLLAKKNIVADFAKSIAVGDSEGDSALLGIVGHPIAFNPSSGLAAVAKRKGWKIVVERKDTVYEVKDYTFLHKRIDQKTSWK